MHRKRIVIIGGGFGGIKAALELAKDDRFKVSLISDKDYFQYFPTLYHTATGGRIAESRVFFDKIFSETKVDTFIGIAKKIDREKKEVRLQSGHVVLYDTLILALGVVTNYFGIKGLSEYAYGTKSVEEAEKLKKHLHDQLTDDRQPDLNYIIIGGGPTGIELAGAMSTYLREIIEKHGMGHRKAHIDLIEAAPRLLPRLPKSMSKAIAHHLRSLGITLYLGKTVEGETADALNISGKALTSHSVVWTAGMATNSFFKDNGFMMSDRGKVVVNGYLAAEENIYVIGDDAATQFSGMAQTALYDAEFISANLKRHANKRTQLTYKPKQPITVIPGGAKWAAMQWGKVVIVGRLAWWLRELADLVAFHDFEPWRQATKQFMTSFGEQEECPICSQIK